MSWYWGLNFAVTTLQAKLFCPALQWQVTECAAVLPA